MTTFTLTVHRSNLLTANERKHRMQVARATKVLRHAACMQAQTVRATPFERAHVIVTVAWPNRRRRDVLNIAPTIKACIDGMTDAGLWDDDDDRHLIGPDFRVSGELSGVKDTTRLTFTIEEVGA